MKNKIYKYILLFLLTFNMILCLGLLKDYNIVGGNTYSNDIPVLSFIYYLFLLYFLVFNGIFFFYVKKNKLRKIYTCIIFLVQFYLVVFFIFCLVYNDIFYWIIKGWKEIGFFYWLKIIKENILENNRYHLIFILEFLIPVRYLYLFRKENTEGNEEK